jgi:hypothetical protein
MEELGMPAGRSEARAATKPKRRPAAPRPRRTESGADAAKRQRLADMLRDLRRDAEQLLANADRLLGRLS